MPVPMVIKHLKATNPEHFMCFDCWYWRQWDNNEMPSGLDQLDAMSKFITSSNVNTFECFRTLSESPEKCRWNSVLSDDLLMIILSTIMDHVVTATWKNAHVFVFLQEKNIVSLEMLKR